jgi:ADP-heptose:LPS heptosyltransferase
MAEPLLRGLRERFPRAHIALLSKPAARVLLEPSGLVDRFIEIDVPWTAFEGKYALHRYRDPRLWSTIRALRRERFDVSIDARMDVRSNLLSRLIGARRRIGFDLPGGAGLLTDRVADPGETTHKVEDWLAMLAPLGAALPSPAEPVLRVQDDARARVADALHALGVPDGAPVVAVHASARQEIRRWPMDRFSALVRALVQRGDVRVLALVDPDGCGEELAADGALCVRASLAELPAYLERCVLYVGNDTGPAHIAAAVGTRTVTIFGPGAAPWFRPYGHGHRIVQVEPMPCRPCFDTCTQPTNRCLQELTVDAVLSTVDDALDDVLAAIGARVDSDSAIGEIMA